MSRFKVIIEFTSKLEFAFKSTLTIIVVANFNILLIDKWERSFNILSFNNNNYSYFLRVEIPSIFNRLY